MIIDNTPAIRAFAQARIDRIQLKTEGLPRTASEIAVIYELELIITLCDGLIRQNELPTKAIGL